MDAVAFLRGMNVGGHRLTNERLVEIVEGLGFDDVTAYQASGNVLFEAAGRSAEELEPLIENGLAAALEYDVPTMVRTVDELRAVLDADPYADLSGQPGGKQQIVFLRTAPSAAARTSLTGLCPDDDHLVVVRREIHWWPNGGYTESKLDWGRIDKDNGPLTMRTRGTVERIVKKMSS